MLYSLALSTRAFIILAYTFLFFLTSDSSTDNAPLLCSYRHVTVSVLHASVLQPLTIA